MYVGHSVLMCKQIKSAFVVKTKTSGTAFVSFYAEACRTVFTTHIAFSTNIDYMRVHLPHELTRPGY